MALGALLAGTGPASAAELLRKNVTAASAVERSCTAGKLGAGGGVAQETVTMPAGGSVVARLGAASGDWDLAIFDGDGDVVAGSASRGAARGRGRLRDRGPAPGRAGMPALRERGDRAP